MLLRRAQRIDGVTVEELLRLADGSLAPACRADVEARVAASAHAGKMLAAQRRSLTATGALAAPPVPTAAPRRGLVLAFAAVLLLAAVSVFAFTRGDGPLDDAVALAAAPATEPVPHHRSFDGVTFPDWGHEFGWHASGARRDEAGGRDADTVYYEHMGHRIGYTVLAGRSVGLPSRGKRIVRDGLAIQLFHEDGKSVAVFERNGRTCVLAGKVLADETLIKLAAWRAR